MPVGSAISIATTRHPDYLYGLPDWELWRYIWESGDTFIHRYLEKWSARESDDDFARRKRNTPNPEFAKSALVDIKNAIFNRMHDISRRGGSPAYQKAVAGLNGGVDRRGSSMNHFIGTQILPELLVMGQVGIYVDNIPPPGPTLADAEQATPYLYMYTVEDTLSWNCSKPNEKSDYRAVLLRDWCLDYDIHFGGIHLPKSSFERFRLVWIGDDGFVRYQFFDQNSNMIDAQGQPYNGEPVKLGLTKIPFVMCDIGGSLLKGIAKHQIALLNLASSDIAYAIMANFPFYVEQRDSRATGSHLKSDVMEDGTSTAGGQGARSQEIKVGAVHGRAYDIKVNEPSFIHPSPEPLEVSMKLQTKLENDIRKLLNLAVVSLGNSRASADARSIDNQGLEAGLAFIGLVLETVERKIADHWSAYEGNDSSDSVIIKYPEQYSLKPMIERLGEAKELTGLMFSIPSTTAKKELAKDATVSLMSGRIAPDRMAKIHKEIDEANYSTSDPKVIELAKEQGLASDITLSNALGFDGNTEIPKANEDHAKRIARIQVAQAAEQGLKNPGARGVNDLETNSDSPKEERDEATDTTTKDTTKKPVRGSGKKVE